MTIEFETGALVCSVHGRAGATELLDAMEAASVAVADALCKRRGAARAGLRPRARASRDAAART
jgi:hypothetical protein